MKLVKIFKLNTLVILLGYLTLMSFSYKGAVFNSTTFPTQFYQCYLSNSVVRGTVEAIQDKQGNLNQSTPQTLMNMNNGGLVVDVVFLACRTVDPQKSANNFIQSIPKNLFVKVWIYVYTTIMTFATECNWNYRNQYSAEDSCNYLKKLISVFKNNGINFGIAATKEGWETLLKGQCDDLSKDMELFWVVYKDGDSTETFSDFRPFGGWVKPSYKLLDNIYPEQQICGGVVLRTYSEKM